MIFYSYDLAGQGYDFDDVLIWCEQTRTATVNYVFDETLIFALEETYQEMQAMNALSRTSAMSNVHVGHIVNNRLAFRVREYQGEAVFRTNYQVDIVSRLYMELLRYGPRRVEVIHIGGQSFAVEGFAAQNGYTRDPVVRYENISGRRTPIHFFDRVNIVEAFIWPVKYGQPAFTQQFSNSHPGLDVQNRNNVTGYTSWVALPNPNRDSRKTGNTVVASKSGVVSHRIVLNASSGNGFTIAHGDGYFTRYLHLHNEGFRNYSPGTRVTQGQIIGLVGQTGNARSMGHVHFEIVRVEGREGFSAAEDAEFFRNEFFQGSSGRVRGYNFSKLNPLVPASNVIMSWWTRRRDVHEN